MGVVHQAIEDGIGQRWVADDFIPTLNRHLAGDDQRTGLVAVLDNFQQIVALLGVKWLWVWRDNLCEKMRQSG